MILSYQIDSPGRPKSEVRSDQCRYGNQFATFGCLKIQENYNMSDKDGHFQKKWHQSVTLRVKNQLNYMPLTFMLCCYIHISVS